MINKKTDGVIIPVVAPSGGLLSGAFYKTGILNGVCQNTGLEGETVQLVTCGVFSLPKTTSQVWAVGEQLYWDPATSKFTNVPGELTSYGMVATAALSADTVGDVRLGHGTPIAAGPIAQQAAVADLTDSTGAGAADATLADGLTSVAASAQTSAAVTGTLTGTVDGALADIAAAAGACAGGAEPSATNVDTAIATAVATIVSGTNEQLKELQTALNEAVADLTALYVFVGTALTDLTTQNQNDADVAAKINAALAKLRLAGVIEDA